jgi:hypothetical protein
LYTVWLATESLKRIPTTTTNNKEDKMSTVKLIKPLVGFAKVSDADVIIRASAVQTAMAGNANYPNPPVDLAVLKTNIEAFVALVAQAADGSKKVIAQKNKQRATVVEMVRMLGRYVEGASKGDMSIFQTSGFQPASTTKAKHSLCRRRSARSLTAPTAVRPKYGSARCGAR